MVEMQKREFDPPLPVIVDPRIERAASCANLVKNAFIQSCNLKYYSERQRKMLLTPDLHAWVLVKKMRDEFGYEQSHASLMKAFNLDAFFDFQPITDPKKRETYDAEIREVYGYLRDGAPQGTIVPMYFQGSRSKAAVMGEYRKADPHLNTHQTMFAENIDWTLRASDVPMVRDGKRIPFGVDREKALSELSDALAALSALEARLVSDREAVLASLDPIRNPDLVPHMRTVPRLLANAFKDPRFDAFLAKMPPSERERLPVSALSGGAVDKEAYANSVREKVRRSVMEGTLTVEGLKALVPWYRMPEGDIPTFESRLAHAASLAAKRRSISASLAASGSLPPLSEFGPTAASNPLVVESVGAHARTLEEIAFANKRIESLKAALSAPADVSRSVIDFLIDFTASRADFPSSFLPGFRNTVLAGLSRYPDLVEMERNGKKIDVAAEIAAQKEGKPVSMVRPSDTIRLTGPMMIDGEIQSTSDDPSRRERMNARTRFFFEFVATIYLPTEVLTPGEGVLPAREDFSGPESELVQKYSYALRRGETLASVLKSRILRYENIKASDPARSQKVAEHFKWQIRALKMDGFLQTESEFNPGAVNENRVIPYYDVRVVPEIWKRYLSERRMADLEFERSVALPYLRIVTVDGAGIDSKRKIFREILARIEASESRLAEYPALREVPYFNDFQYELFMKRFFERSLNDSGTDLSSDFFRDVRPNRSFYIRYDDLAAIAAEISDAAGLETPELKPVDEAVIASVVRNRFNASLVKNVLVAETYAVDGRLGFRKTAKRVREVLPFFGNSSHGDFQIRVAELSGSFAKEGRLFRLEGEKEIPLEWPTLANLRDAANATLREDIAKIASSHLRNVAYARFGEDAKKLARVRQILERSEISRKDMAYVRNILVELMRIDSGDASNLVGKAFSAALLDSKIALHFRKTTYWLSEMEIPLDYLADSDEERSKFERTIALVNNLSEDKVLLALTENFVIRVLSDGLGAELSPPDVYARPSNPWKKFKQEIARQLEYDRPTFLAHFAQYVSSAKERLAGKGFAPKERERLAATVAVFEGYLAEMSKSKNFNADAFRLLRDERLRNVLLASKLPWTPFPEISELSRDDFRSSVFNYVAKMERRKKAAPGTKTVSAFLRDPKK